MSTPTICPAGKYCGATTVGGTGDVSIYGTVTPGECNVGTYSKITGLDESGDCWPCKPGHYCGTTGIDGSATSPLACTAGYYCKTSATSATPTTDTVNYNYGKCPDNHYCAGSVAQGSPCWPGTEADGSSATLYTLSTECTNCASTQWCNTIVNHAGTVTMTTANCDAGFFCVAGSVQARNNNAWCTPGTKCTTGVSAVTNCVAGEYQPNYAQDECLPCPAGFYCAGVGPVNGANNEATALSDQTSTYYLCPVGYYCPQGTTSSTQYPCPVGSYNPTTGAKDNTFCIPCPPGHFCASAA